MHPRSLHARPRTDRLFIVMGLAALVACVLLATVDTRDTPPAVSAQVLRADFAAVAE